MIVNHNLMSFMSNLCIKSNFDIYFLVRLIIMIIILIRSILSQERLLSGASTALQLSLAQ